jgi:MFS family permease
MGACLSSLFNVALGDIAHDEAGSASGALSAVQQLATAIGSAVVTTVFFQVDASHGGATAITTTVFVVAMIFAACLSLVWLLPRAAALAESPLDEPGPPR